MKKKKKKESHAVQTKTGRYCSTSNPNDIKGKKMLLSTTKQLKKPWQSDTAPQDWFYLVKKYI